MERLRRNEIMWLSELDIDIPCQLKALEYIIDDKDVFEKN